MNEEQIIKALQSLAHYVVRNEIVCEQLLERLGASRDEIGAKVREIDEQLKTETAWQRRFPELFPD